MELLKKTVGIDFWPFPWCSDDMFNAELLEVLCCPETRQALEVAEPALIARLNELIGRSTLKNAAGQSVTERIDNGLVRADGKVLYLIRQNVPVMLVGQALPLSA